MQYTRRKSYQSKLTDVDYFVLKHLGEFIYKKLDQLIVSKSILVADIGCGEQPMRSYIEALGGIYTGIDIAQNSSSTVDIISSITNISLPDNSFHIILCTEVLEHISNTSVAFQELARLLKPNGQLIITVPFAYPLHEEPYDFVRLTPHQLYECARKNNLEITEIVTSGNELEVMATVWCNMWTRMNRANLDPLKKLQEIWNLLMVFSMNAITTIASNKIDSILPKKYYLNAMAVFQKK